MGCIVIDNSVVMTWIIEDQADAYADAVHDALGDVEAIMPPLWPFEVANSLLVAERRKLLTRVKSDSFLGESDCIIYLVEPAVAPGDKNLQRGSDSRVHGMACDVGQVLLGDCQRVPDRLGVRDEDVKLGLITRAETGRGRDVHTGVADRLGNLRQRAGPVLDVDDEVEWHLGSP